jgi:hypothetical protein
MQKPCCRALDRHTIEQRALAAMLPELYDLQQAQEHNDWHSDDVFQQSVHLFQWVVELPESLSVYVCADHAALQDILTSAVDGARTDHTHTLKDVLSFAALIHDVGKRATLQRDDTGRTRCPGHEALGARMAPDICARFDFTPVEIHQITRLVGNHGEPYTLFKAIEPLPEPRRKEAVQRFTAVHADQLLPVLLLAYGDLVTSHLAEIRPSRYACVLDCYRQWLQAALKIGDERLEIA